MLLATPIVLVTPQTGELRLDAGGAYLLPAASLREPQGRRPEGTTMTRWDLCDGSTRRAQGNEALPASRAWTP